jgi:hypothetical protein
MNSDNPALIRLLIANIIGYLAAEYSNGHDLQLAEGLQYVLDSPIYPKLMDPANALFEESLPVLYEQIL